MSMSIASTMRYGFGLSELEEDMNITIDNTRLTPAISKREIAFVLYCFSKEFNGDERKVAQRVHEMTVKEWQAARDMLKDHDAWKATQ